MVVNALTIPEGGAPYAGIQVRAFPCRERVQLKLLLVGFLPRKNAMYAFDLDGVRVLHTGDIGVPFKKKYLDELRSKVDVMFALERRHPQHRPREADGGHPGDQAAHGDPHALLQPQGAA